MRTSLKTIMLAGLGAALLLQEAPPASAADLAVTPVKKRVFVGHRSRIVRDLDGTQIVVRRLRPVLTAYDGTLRPMYVNISVRSASVTPRYYLNGQPVLPHWPRGWPRQFRGRV